MLDKIKQIKKLKDLQSSMKKELFEAEKSGVKVILNGNFELEEICLNSDIAKEEQEKIIKDCFSDALKKAQMSATQKFSGLI